MEAQKQIIRIYNDNDNVCGAGFLVSRRLAVTAAHVIASISNISEYSSFTPSSDIFIDFPFSSNSSRYRSKVTFWNIDDDVAGLELDEDAPSDLPVVPMQYGPIEEGSVFRAFGFPRGRDSGVWAAGELLGETPAGHLQIAAQQIGPSFQAGFSGSPVINANSGRIEGLVVARDHKGTAYAVPSFKILSLWDALRTSSEPSEVQAPQQQCPMIFLCHASEDKSEIRRIYSRLFNEGFKPWFDEINLLPGQKWDKEIRRAVRKCDAILVCLSKNSINKKGYVQKEIKFALDVADEQPEDVIFLIPARLEECSVPDRLTEYQWVDLFHANGYSKLLASLNLVKEANCNEP